MHDQAEARLAAVCPQLAGRIGTALQFADAIAKNRLPQVSPAAFVLPLGLRGGAASAAAGMFVQSLDRLMGVVLVVRSAGDPLGARLADTLEPLIDAVIQGFAGWAPDGAIGVFRLQRAELVSLAEGAATFQIDFVLDDQLRIAA